MAEITAGINYAHVDALLKAADTRKKCTADGQQLATQGHFILLYGGTMDISDFQELDSAGKLWKRLQSEFDGLANRSGSHGKTYLETSTDKNHVRVAHGVIFREAYARCFPGAVFFKATSIDETYGIAVVMGGSLIGGIMGMRGTETGALPVEATDAEVFAPFACESNNYYLTEDDGLNQRVADLEGELTSEESELRRLSDECDELEESIEEIKGRIEAIRKERAARREATA